MNTLRVIYLGHVDSNQIIQELAKLEVHLLEEDDEKRELLFELDSVHLLPRNMRLIRRVLHGLTSTFHIHFA